jgi:hypothetical protein
MKACGSPTTTSDSLLELIPRCGDIDVVRRAEEVKIVSRYETVDTRDERGRLGVHRLHRHDGSHRR